MIEHPLAKPSGCYAPNPQVGEELIVTRCPAACLPSFEIQSILKISETFGRLATLMQWNRTLGPAFEATSRSQQELVWSARAARFAIHVAQKRRSVFRISF